MPGFMDRFRALEQTRIQNENIASLDRQKREKDALQALNVKKGPGYEAFAQTEAEKRAGVVPAGFEGLRDRETGDLLDKYKINPFAGEASQRLRAEALGTGPSPWASGALQRQKFEEGQARGAVGLQQQQAQSQAQAGLMRMGGLGGGARTSLARSGARDALMAGQNVGAQGIMQRFGINESDAQRRQQLLGQTADVERGADLQNLGTVQQDIGTRAAFDANRYNQQMQAWAAQQSAAATAAAGRPKGKK